MNAKDLITLWGDAKNPLNEYACRQWSGLLSDFYKPRWQLFFTRATQSLNQQTNFNTNLFKEEVSNWEWKWVNQRKDYPTKTIGSPVTVALQMYQKYRRTMGPVHP
ncbi:hypothetical protein D3C87_1107750 [compost metagenome]